MFIYSRWWRMRDMKRVNMSCPFLFGNGCVELQKLVVQSFAHLGTHHEIVK